jgi:RNA polymerase sigma-70 factor (ECF subfamily)
VENETELIQRSRKGSAEAFTRLVLLHQARVRAYLGQYFRNSDLVDDQAQETFLSAYRTLDTYQDDRPFASWLFGIAKHRALDSLRAEARRRARENSRWESALATWRLEEAESGPTAEREPEVAALEQCIGKLPEPSARLVEEHYFENRSAADLARLRGKSEGSIRMMLLRIRQLLRDCIGKRLVVGGA